MSIIGALLGSEKRSFGTQLSSVIAGGRLSSTGVSVTEEGSLRNMAVYACVRIISQSLAALPLILYERRGRERIRARDHSVYSILNSIGNREQTAFEVRETRLAHVLLWGNSFAEIEYDERWNVVGLWPLDPDRVGVERDVRSGDLNYLYWSESKGGITLPSWKVMHLRNTIIRGAVGISPIRQAMNAIGLGQATEQFGSKYFLNGSRPSVILKYPGQLKPEALSRLRDSFSSAWSGLENAHKVAVLEDGIEPETVGIPPEEAQFLESRRFQIAEIARLYNVPLDMLAENAGTATYASAEQHRMNFDQMTLLPWAERDEQALARDLLTPKERETYEIEYLIDGFERADIETRYQAFMTGKQGGWLSTNEIRERENLNPIQGGDTYMEPLNMAPAGSQAKNEDSKRSAGVARETRAADEVATDRRRLIERQYGLFEDVTKRLAKREIADLRRAVKKYLNGDSPDVDGFLAWLADFYADLRQVVPEMFRALLLAAAEGMGFDVARELGEDEDKIVTSDLEGQLGEWIDDYLGAFASQYVFDGQDQLAALLDEAEEPAEAVSERLDEWGEKRAAKTARTQVFEACNALVIAWYGVYGVRRLVWAGGDCAFCRKLNGKIIDIDDYFVRGGQRMVSSEGGETMLVRRDAKHGPLHRGCDCTVRAA